MALVIFGRRKPDHQYEERLEEAQLALIEARGARRAAETVARRTDRVLAHIKAQVQL